MSGKSAGAYQSHLRVAWLRHRTGAAAATAPPTGEAGCRAIMIDALVAGLVAGYGIAMPVGAVATYLVALTARTSLKVGAAAALGVATADGFYALVAVAGGSALTPAIRPVALPLRWISALVLIALAARGAAVAIGRYRRRGPAGVVAGAPAGPARAYLGTLGITIVNPTTVIYFAALVLGSRSVVIADHPEQAAFILAAFAASASWQLLLAGGGALLGRALTSGRGQLVTALVASAVIGVLGARLLLAAG